MPMTMAEKILARAAGRSQTVAGEIVDAAVNVAMSHENAGMVLHHFKTIGASRVWDPERIVIVFDHRIPAESERTAGQLASMGAGKAASCPHMAGAKKMPTNPPDVVNAHTPAGVGR